MSLDDDDTPFGPSPSRPPPNDADPDHAPEDDEEDQANQDFSKFAASLAAGGVKKKHVSSQTLRRGEKDFETHGTQVQADKLENSRNMMQEVLSYTRVHRSASAWVRGWYSPETWEDYDEEVDEGEEEGKPKGKAHRAELPRRPTHARERVVVVEADKGAVVTSLGRSVVTKKGGEQSSGYVAGADRLWLLPEEALFLVERGSLDLWWPSRTLEELFPSSDDEPEEKGKNKAASMPPRDEDYELGVPLSLQAAYSLLIGPDGERGKVSLQKYQVYLNLKRTGYNVLRAAPIPPPMPHPPAPAQAQTIWQWLRSLISSRSTTTPTAIDYTTRPLYGPLVLPGLYRSYNDMFRQLDVSYAPPTTTTTTPEELKEPEEPYRVHYHVWKTSTGGPFSKTRPSPPDFFIAVVDAHDTTVPTAEQLTALLNSTPPSPPTGYLMQNNRLYPRLRHGKRNVLIAVVDHGLVNYTRLAEGDFGSDNLVGRWDNTRGFRGGKRGGGRGGKGRHSTGRKR